jgi:hypothetical protein
MSFLTQPLSFPAVIVSRPLASFLNLLDLNDNLINQQEELPVFAASRI